MEEKNKEDKKITPKAKTTNKFKAKCFHCKNKETMTTKAGISYTLPFAYVSLKKDSKLLKECKNYVKESAKKYKKDNVIKRVIKKGCPVCHNDIIINCKDYTEFYKTKPKAKKENKNEK